MVLDDWDKADWDECIRTKPPPPLRQGAEPDFDGSDAENYVSDTVRKMREERRRKEDRRARQKQQEIERKKRFLEENRPGGIDDSEVLDELMKETEDVYRAK